jgi:hypothetical protein
MSKLRADNFDLERLRIDPNDGELMRLAKVPAKIQKRREQFIMVPWGWLEGLARAPASTFHVALYLLHLHWKDHGNPVKVPNATLRTLGVSRQSKWRALADLEERGLVSVERRPSRSPLVHLSHF